jgi:ribosomal protein S18 acetylase RimI-like enzyme
VNPFEIRPIQVDEASAYRSLMLDAYQNAPTAFTSSHAERERLGLDWWAARLRVGTGPSCVLGAFDKNQLIGTVALSFETRDRTRHKVSVIAMYVTPMERGRGIGAALLSAAIERASCYPEIQVLQLTVTEGNAAAQKLYESQGFVVFGKEPFAVAHDNTFLTKLHLWRAIVR